MVLFYWLKPDDFHIKDTTVRISNMLLWAALMLLPALVCVFLLDFNSFSFNFYNEKEVIANSYSKIKTSEYEIQQVQLPLYQKALPAIAEFDLNNTVEVVSRASGFVEQGLKRLNDRVENGDVLFSVRSADGNDLARELNAKYVQWETKHAFVQFVLKEYQAIKALNVQNINKEDSKYLARFREQLSVSKEAYKLAVVNRDRTARLAAKRSATQKSKEIADAQAIVAKNKLIANIELARVDAQQRLASEKTKLEFIIQEYKAIKEKLDMLGKREEQNSVFDHKSSVDGLSLIHI